MIIDHPSFRNNLPILWLYPPFRATNFHQLHLQSHVIPQPHDAQRPDGTRGNGLRNEGTARGTAEKDVEHVVIDNMNR